MSGGEKVRTIALVVLLAIVLAVLLTLHLNVRLPSDAAWRLREWNPPGDTMAQHFEGLPKITGAQLCGGSLVILALACVVWALAQLK